LELHARGFGDVLDEQLGKIRLARFRAQAGKLGNPDANGIIARRLRVGKGFQISAWLDGHFGRSPGVNSAYITTSTSEEYSVSMRLTAMKMSGYKSFVEPTTIKFPSNLMGIVGPNGCGKSNIIDAVRWVMGETSARQLRGESMSDVI